MSALAALYHLINFVLPALCVGAALAVFGQRDSKHPWQRNWFWNSLAGVVALAVGLVLFGVDGKMMSYALLLLACSGVQLLRGRK